MWEYIHRVDGIWWQEAAVVVVWLEVAAELQLESIHRRRTYRESKKPKLICHRRK